MRHRGKIEAVIDNAQRACELVRETGTLAAYFWRFEPAAHERDAHRSVSVSRASDHAQGCVTRAQVEKARKSFKRP